MPAYLELRLHCDCEGCGFWDTYLVADYGYDDVEEEAPVYEMQDDIESAAMQDGWYPDDDGLWYCPDCAKKKGLYHDPFKKEVE